MPELLLFCLATAGMTSIVVKGAIFRPFRDWLADRAAHVEARRAKHGKQCGFSFILFVNELVSCVQCTGFWCGIFCGLFLITSGFAATMGMLPNFLARSQTEMGVSANFRVFVNLIMMLFCCGVGGSFAAMLGDVLFETLYFTKENAARRLNAEEHHHHHGEAVNEETAAHETENNEPLNEDLEFSPEEPDGLVDER